MPSFSAFRDRKNQGGYVTSILDPSYELIIEGVGENKALGVGITQFVKNIEYETADGLPDVLKMRVSNIDGIFTDLRMFQIGNECSVKFGYGGSLAYMGRVEFTRPRYLFPQNEEPIIEITGYSAEIRMMEGKSVKAKSTRNQRQATAKARKDIKRLFVKPTTTSVLEEICRDYEFQTDIDHLDIGQFDDPGRDGIVQHPAMSDYDFVRALSNITGYIFWVDADPIGTWTMHFKKPDKNGIVKGIQAKQYTLDWGHTLLAFEPTWGLRDVKTKMIVEVRNPEKGVSHSVELVDDESCPDILWTGKDLEIMDARIETGGSAKIYLGEFQIEVITNKHFTSDAQVRLWANQWFRRNRQNFVTGAGTAIGIESLAARQTHFLTAMGDVIDGEYYFNKVRHILNSEQGYITTFDARRVIGSPAPESAGSDAHEKRSHGHRSTNRPPRDPPKHHITEIA